MGRRQATLDRFLATRPGGAFVTAIIPEPSSTVHTSEERCSTPRMAATAAGIVVRTDAERGVTRKAVEWKIRAIESDSPFTLSDGTLHNYALLTGLSVGQRLIYSDAIGLTVGQRPRVITVEVDGGRAQRGLVIATKADTEIRRVSWCKWKVRSQAEASRDTWYLVVKAGTGFRCNCPDAMKHVSEECKHASAVRFAERIRDAVRRDYEKRAAEACPIPNLPPCRSCGGTDFIQKGLRRCQRGKVQRFKCKSCGGRFTVDDGFARLKCRPQIVSAVFDLHAGGMHYRGIQRHMEQHWKGANGEGVSISIGTVNNWVHRIGSRLDGYYREAVEKGQIRAGPAWNGDEVEESGKKRATEVGKARLRRRIWTWNWLDSRTKLWLCSALSTERDLSAGRRSVRKAIESGGHLPSAATTDGAFQYGEAIRKEVGRTEAPVSHFICPPIQKMRVDLHPGNNIAEALNSRQRDMTRDFRGLVKGAGPVGYLRSAQELMDGIRAHRNLIQPSLALPGAKTPAEAAGLVAPSIQGYNRLMSMVAVNHRNREEVARMQSGPAIEHRGQERGEGPDD
jgi:transposase-like protein